MSGKGGLRGDKDEARLTQDPSEGGATGAPLGTSPERSTAERSTSDPNTPDRSSSGGSISDPSTSDRKASDRSASEPGSSAPKTPDPNTPDRSSSGGSISDPSSSDSSASELKTSDSTTSDRKTPDHSTSDPSTSDPNTSDHSTSDSSPSAPPPSDPKSQAPLTSTSSTPNPPNLAPSESQAPALKDSEPESSTPEKSGAGSGGSGGGGSGGGGDGGSGGSGDSDDDPWGDDEEGPEDDVQLPLLGHLAELRERLKWSVLAVLGGFALSYGFARQIYDWLMEPVMSALPEGEQKLHFTGAVEPFFTYLKVAVYTGLFIATPVILYQLWAFISPGLYRRERKALVPFVVLGTFFFLTGGAFAHYVVMPFAFNFLIGEFSNPGIQPMLVMKEQLSLVLTMTLAFAVVFEMPVILALLVKMGLVKVKTLRSIRRYAIVANVAIAAIVTPTGDPFNLALMAVPMMICYELGIIMATFVSPVERDLEEEEEEEQAQAQAS